MPPRVVLDTHVVLSALLFGGGPAGRVRAGWQEGRFVPLVSTATAQELVRVLAYPKFRLSPVVTVGAFCERLLKNGPPLR